MANNVYLLDNRLIDIFTSTQKHGSATEIKPDTAIPTHL
jgi:hypothetical protein